MQQIGDIELVSNKIEFPGGLLMKFHKGVELGHA